MSDFVRFVIITALPKEAADRFDLARRNVCRIARSRAALAYPPHVTLRTGALVPRESLDSFLGEFGETVGAWDPFPVRTGRLVVTTYADGNAEKHLICYEIQKDAALMEMNARLLRYEKWRASNRLVFQPHLTLAFDDLTEDGAQSVRAWRDENPDALPAGFRWRCDNVGVYVRVGGLWTLHTEWRARVSPGVREQH
jgi:2'-5' RNA ligase